MANFYKDRHGDILPFHSIIRVMDVLGGQSKRVMFVNGCVDIEKEEMEEFLTAYEEWLEKSVDNQKLSLYDYSTKSFEGV